MEPKLSDYKYWITCKADEIAEDEYGKDYYDLTDEEQGKVYQKATASYTDAYSGMMDYYQETRKEDVNR